MTTVAYDGRYLSADTLSHRHNTPSNLLAPKIDMFDGFAYAVAGEWMAAFPALIAWHQAGARPADWPPQLPGKGCMFIVEIATRRMWTVSDVCIYIDEEAAPFSCGSGIDMALTAMDCGRNAMEAVQMASRRDLHTNDVIDFIDLEWPEWGVQRWDGHMPSMAHPMGVRGPENLTIHPKFEHIEGPAEQDVTSWAAPPDMSGVIMKAAGIKPERIDINLGTLTRRFDEEDAPAPTEMVHLNGDISTVTHTFDELRATGNTAVEAGGELTAKISNWLTGYPAGGTIMWRVRPYVELHYDIEADKAEWRGYCRMLVLPWARPKQRDTMLMDDPNDNAGADREANARWFKEDMTRPKRKVMAMDGERVIDCMFRQNECEPCGECWTCNRMGYGKPVPQSSTISLEELRRTFNPGLHAVFDGDTGSLLSCGGKKCGACMACINPVPLCQHEQQHAMAYGGVIDAAGRHAIQTADAIGASDICTHGYVLRTCNTCSKIDRAVAELHDAEKKTTAA